MFEEFRKAWRGAVENFWRELEEREDDDASSRGAFREVRAARGQLDRLDREIEATDRRAREERDQATACERRERLATGIGDMETARLAAEYRGRHLERAAVLGAKLEALRGERRLCARDLEEMERALAADPSLAARVAVEELDRHPQEAEFRRVEQAERERAAQERLEELKRRMEG